MRPSLFLLPGGRAWQPSRLLTAKLGRPRCSYSSTRAPGGLDIEALEKAMQARPAQVTPDILTRTQSRLLDLALSDCLPPARVPAPRATTATATAEEGPAFLAPGNHLVHFPLALSSASLCPDGTDPYHSPGAPFERRVWARGALTFAEPLATEGQAAHCHERILDVTASGTPGDEKIHVTVGRSYRMGTDPTATRGPGLVQERRTLVFMRPLSREQAAASVEQPRRSLRPPLSYQAPCFSHTLTPTPKLLFQYSALSYNAHAIHHNPQYCRDVEGYRDLLVHGPLSLTLMLRVLDTQLPRDTVIHTFEYSHMAPLYVNEPMTIHVMPSRHKGQHRPGQWEVWIEGPGGGMCVKGHCTTRSCSPAAQAPA